MDRGLSGIMDGPPVTLEMARRYGGCVGCHEPSLHTMESGWNAAGTNLPVALEAMLNNGRDRTGKKRSATETGDPRQFTSFEELREA